MILSDAYLKDGHLEVDLVYLPFTRFFYSKLRGFCTSTASINVLVRKGKGASKGVQRSPTQSYRMATRGKRYLYFVRTKQNPSGKLSSVGRCLCLERYIDPLTLTVWFACDGGFLDVEKTIGLDLTSFTTNCENKLVDFLLKKYGINSHVINVGKSPTTQRQWRRLIINKNDYPKFYTLIRSYSKTSETIVRLF